MNFFLRLKSWQIFIVFMGIVLFAPNIIANSSNPEVALFIMNFVFIALYFGWIVSILYGARKFLPNKFKVSLKIVNYGVIYLLIYLIFSFVMNNSKISGWLIVPHLIGMYFIFYIFIYASKILVQLEQEKKITFIEYAPFMLAFWFFPIGVWIIQPRVNRLILRK